MSYLSSIERYHEYHEAIRELLGSMLAGIGRGAAIMPSVWMMFTAIGLLMAPGVYVYLGAQAEVKLIKNVIRK